VLIRGLLVVAPALRGRLDRILRDEEIVVQAAAPDDLQDALAADACDLLFVASSRLAAPVRESVTRLRDTAAACEVVVLQDREDAEERAALLGAGCFGVVSAELSDDGLRRALAAYVRRRREQLHAQVDARPDERDAAVDVPPRSPAMRQCLERAARAAAADSPVLLLGETGAGKEWVARRIHVASRRSQGPFVAVNCAALPESLWESEMFGHERGAFTGAERGRRGPFEVAHGGTLFLDEIGEVPLHLQAKLLRVLEDRRIQRVGSDRGVAVDVRLMAATNRDLEAALEASAFRADLYFRLAVLALRVPPLRDRREDLPALAEAFLARLRRSFRPQVARLRPEVLDAFAAYAWPGNVRELANAIETAMMLTESDEIGLAALPLRIRAALGRGAGRAAERLGAAKASVRKERPTSHRTLAEVLEQVVQEAEREYLRGLLAETGGRLAETARRAGIAPRSLYGKMRRHGLRKEEFREPRAVRADRR
jgi:DNA-binding NtrC family response regulator